MANINEYTNNKNLFSSTNFFVFNSLKLKNFYTKITLIMYKLLQYHDFF